MFRTLSRSLGINPLDRMLKRLAKRGGRSVLMGWNRGLGDIALGLYAVVQRIRDMVPNAKITIMGRENLRDGFSMLDGVEFIAGDGWVRGEPYQLDCDDRYDLVIERPSPTDWCSWQHGRLTPKLKWDSRNDLLYHKFNLPNGFTYVGVQISAETNYGHWRNWPLQRWNQLFDRLQGLGFVRVLLFGYGNEMNFVHPNIVDLRGKTTLFELLSIIKNRCFGLVLPDSGIASMTYYLDQSFPLRLVTLWADPKHGILKQKVASPNPCLVHCPLVGEKRDLSSIGAESVFEALFPKKNYFPVGSCIHVEPSLKKVENAGCIILAGGQGTRLNSSGPKGMFCVKGKSLFQHLCDQAPQNMPIVVMTSIHNHDETVRYFQEHSHFGKNVSFLQQNSLPLLDANYRELQMVPDGNGGVFERFCASGLADLWEQQGIDTALIVPVDNYLAGVADASLLEHHRKSHADITIKCIERKTGEKMGVLVEENGRIAVAEYFDLTLEQLSMASFRYAYTGQIAVSMFFLRKAAKLDLPLRWVWKNGWKRERLIFDAFALAEKVQAICYPREACYAPIKTLADAERIQL